MSTELTRLTHKIALYCSSRSRRPVRKALDTPSYDSPSKASNRNSIQHFTEKFLVIFSPFQPASVYKSNMLLYINVNIRTLSQTGAVRTHSNEIKCNTSLSLAQNNTSYKNKNVWVQVKLSQCLNKYQP